MTTVSAPHRLSRNTRYIAWLISDTSKGLAAALFGFAIPLLALIVTNDPAQAGIIAAAGMVVRLLTTLAGGVLADRHRRILLMVTGSAIGAVLAGAFTLLALGDALTFTTLLVIDVLLAARSGLFDVAGETAVKEIVPDEAMGRAQAANQGRDAALQLAGGPLGGVLLAAGGWLVGVVMTACHLIAAATAWMLERSVRRTDAAEPAYGPSDMAGESPAIVTGAPVFADAAESATDAVVAVAAPVDSPSDGATSAYAATAGSASVGSASVGLESGPSATAGSKRSAGAEIREGFAWLFSRTDLRGVLLITTIINLGFNAAITTVVYALQQAGHSEITIGWMSAGIGTMMLIGALVAPMLVPRIGAGVLTISGLVVATGGAIVLTMVHEPWAIVGVLGAAVFLVPALNAGMLGYFMVATPTELLGRANSASMILAMGAMPLAPLIAGFGLSRLGRDGTILICAGVCAVAAVLAIASRALRSLPTEAGWVAHAKQFEV